MQTPTPQTGVLSKPIGAFESGRYRNLFAELLGKNDAEIQQKIEQAWEQLFYGDDDSQRIYYPVGRDMAYIKDIAHNDVRTEGMSYGMMLAVQLDKQEEFDRLWKWAYTYMLHKDGPYQGYFAWHTTDTGKQIDANPAPDGEEWCASRLSDSVISFSTDSAEVSRSRVEMSARRVSNCTCRRSNDGLWPASGATPTKPISR